MSQFTPEAAAAVRSFRDDGGAVVFLASVAAPSGATANLNAIADELDARLRVGEDRVTDATHNIAGDPVLPTTTDVIVSPDPPRNPGRGNGGDNGRGSDDDGAGDGRGPGGTNGRGPRDCLFGRESRSVHDFPCVH